MHDNIRDNILSFKSGDKNLINSFCPISLFPSISKVLEKLIKTRFKSFFDKHDYQYSFREKHSVVHALHDGI